MKTDGILKKLKKGFAKAAAIITSLALVTVPVLADDSTDTSSQTSGASGAAGTMTIPVTLDLTYNDKDSIQPLSFTCNITPDASLPAASDDAAPDTRFAGVAQGASVVENSSAPQEGSQTNTAVYTAQVQFDVSKFTLPGLYVYTLQPVVSLGGKTYEPTAIDGLTIDPQSLTAEVWIVDQSDGSLGVGGVDIYQSSDETQKISKAGFKGNFQTQSVSLTKMITGNQADMEAKFPFTFTIQGTPGQVITYKLPDGTTNTLTISDKGTATVQSPIELGNKQTVTVYGLTPKDSYSFKETNSSDYTQTYQIDDGKETAATDGAVATTTIGQADQKVTFTNNKEGSLPTGMIQTYLPYVLVVALVLVFGGFYLARRKHE